MLMPAGPFVAREADNSTARSWLGSEAELSGVD